MTGDAQLHSAMQLRTAVERYELLRSAALGTALPPEARGGLTILLHRGMRAWARAVLLGVRQPSASALPAAGLPIFGKAPERRTVVHLLAAMALAVSERRIA